MWRGGLEVVVVGGWGSIIRVVIRGLMYWVFVFGNDILSRNVISWSLFKWELGNVLVKMSFD